MSTFPASAAAADPVALRHGAVAAGRAVAHHLDVVVRALVLLGERCGAGVLRARADLCDHLLLRRAAALVLAALLALDDRVERRGARLGDVRLRHRAAVAGAVGAA
jgi:hypothetical protein